MAIFTFLFLPLVLIILWISAFARKRRRGLFLSLLFFGGTMTIGIWSIFQSRSSTAGIGILFMPFYAAISGSFAWGFAQLNNSSDVKRKFFSWVLLGLGTSVSVYLIYSGFQTRAKNAERDLQQKIRSESILRNKNWIKENLSHQVGNEEKWLDNLIEEKKDDATFLIPILEFPQVSTNSLAKLAEVKDMGVVLMVARHKNASANILEKIYTTKEYPEYYYQALATNPNTSPDILDKLHERPSHMTTLDQSLAQNPSIKKETLQKIANSLKVRTLWNVISNPVCDCEILRTINKNLDNKKLEDNYADWERFQKDLKSKLEKCQD